MSTRQRHNLELALGWTPGTVNAVLAGRAPAIAATQVVAASDAYRIRYQVLYDRIREYAATQGEPVESDLLALIGEAEAVRLPQTRPITRGPYTTPRTPGEKTA
ncbi:hypothetical protein [Nocardia farcinica]|uniref:hypothetical protein n=1 Tax=Nocardia farcinica TaxID=37329 RepID=UPI00245429F1|nr:hypothetical protein [Nocardia farcinica]